MVFLCLSAALPGLKPVLQSLDWGVLAGAEMPAPLLPLSLARLLGVSHNTYPEHSLVGPGKAPTPLPTSTCED